MSEIKTTSQASSEKKGGTVDVQELKAQAAEKVQKEVEKAVTAVADVVVQHHAPPGFPHLPRQKDE